MSEQAPAGKSTYGILSTADIEGFDSLAELALDMRSSWSHATGQVWRQLDLDLWELTQNPFYSGGLGNVAGNQLKAASDLGVPVIGVGLLYQQGYCRQLIDRDGAQRPLRSRNNWTRQTQR